MFQAKAEKRLYRVLSGCTYCNGAVFASLGFIMNGEQVVKCFHCGRMYRRENGRLVLWPYREYPHLAAWRKNFTK